MDFCLALALACQPHQLPVVADYLRGSGRRGWIQRLEARRGCERRDWRCW